MSAEAGRTVPDDHRGGSERCELGREPSRRDERLHIVLAQAVDLAQPRRRAGPPAFAGLQRAVPQAVIDVGLARLHAMLAGAAHDLRWRIEAHGLGVEQRGGKGRG